MLIKRKFTAHLIVAVLFILITIAATWPTIMNLGTHIYANDGDALNGIWFLQWQKDCASANGFSVDMVKQCDIIAYPYGFSYNNAPPEIVSMLPARILAISFNPAVAYNILTIFSFIAAALTMYLLAFFVTGSVTASFFAGLIFAFNPYHFVQAREHISLANIQWVPLYFLALLFHSRRQSWLSAILAAIAFLSLAFLNLYYAVFALVLTVVFLAVRYFCVRMKVAGLSGIQYGKVLIAALIVLTFVYIGFKSPYIEQSQGVDQHNVPLRYVSDLSAFPSAYIVPAYDNPILGQRGNVPVAGKIEAGASEHALYLGIIPLIFGIIGSGSVIYCRKRAGELDLSSTKTAYFAVVFLVFFLASILFSLKPQLSIFGTTINMPSYYLYGIFGFLRTISRWALFAYMSLAVLAAIGMKRLLGSLTHKRRIALFVIAIALLAVEYSYYPNQLLYDLRLESQPSEYIWLAKNKGKAPIAEYPVPARAGADFQKRAVGQTWHKRPTVNPEISVRLERRNCLDDLNNPTVRGALAGYGVEYVIIHTDEYRRDGKALPNLSKGEAIRVAEFSGSTVYRLTAKPMQAVVVVNQGCFDPQAWGGWQDWREWRWTDGDVDLEAVLLTTGSRKGDIAFDIMTLGRPMKLRLSCNGREYSTEVSADSTEVVFRGVDLKTDSNKVVISADAASVSIDTIMKNGDPRTAKYGIKDIRFITDKQVSMKGVGR